jgi:flotillin
MFTLIVVASLVVSFLAFVLFFVSNYRKAEPNEALIFTGRTHKIKVIGQDGKATGETIVRGWRAVIGGAKLKIPVLEKISKMSLKTMNLPDVKVTSAYSKEGVPVTIEAVANVKISSEDALFARAVERFLGVEPSQIQRIIKETLEGQLRDIIGVLTVEELYQKRDMFVNKVLEQAGEELAKLGVIIDIINVQDIKDDRNYLESLGRSRTAEVIRDAEIGEAQANRDSMKESETAKREGEVVKAEQEKLISEAEKDRNVAQKQYIGETLAATKKAEQEGPLAEAKARQAVVTEQQGVLQAEQEARKAVEAARAEAETEKKRAEVIVPAEAQRDAAIAKAEGEAQAIRRVAEAQAAAIELKLKAEADGLKEKADAWEKYGEAAKIDLVLRAMENIAGKNADALKSVGFEQLE